MATYHADIKSARINTEKLLSTSPTPANAKQHAQLNLLEIRIADLKVAVANINASGGLIDSAANAALTNLFSLL